MFVRCLCGVCEVFVEVFVRCLRDVCVVFVRCL